MSPNPGTNWQEILARKAAGRAAAGPPPRRDACPPLEEWARWQAGQLSEVRAMELILHAADCEACGALVADLRAEDAASAPEVPPAEWREQMAARLARAGSVPAGVRPAVARQRPIQRAWLPLAAALVLAALGGTGWWAVRQRSAAPVLASLARTYSEERPFPARFSGAAYGPLRVTRGGTPARPPELLEAEARATRELRAHPDDPGWLRAIARADLLQGDYAQAIAELRHAQELAGNSAEVLGDLAIAYLERGTTEPRAADIATATELLTQAIQLDPRNPVYRFNRALAREALPAPHEAADDWREFLELEPKGGWAEEARDHLRRLEQLIGKQRASSDDTGADLRPATFLAALKQNDSARIAELTAAAASAHGDLWPRDLATDARRGGLAPALDLLLRADDAAAHGQPDDARDLARQAERLLAGRGSAAGVALAQYQQAHALERGSHPEPCEALARPAAARAGERGYIWLAAQLNLTVAECDEMQRRLTEAEAATAEAETTAARGRYTATLLELAAWRAALFRYIGSYTDVLRISRASLAAYWEGSYPLAQGYQCYFEMAGAARGMSLHSAAATLSREAAEIAALRHDPTIQGMMLSIHGQDLLHAGRAGDAEESFRQADALLASLKPTPAAQLFQAYASLGRAEAAELRHQPGEGLARLQRLGAALGSIHNPVVEVRYGRLRGDLLQQSGDMAGAEAAFRETLTCCASGGPEMTSEAAAALGGLVELTIRHGGTSEALTLWGKYCPAFRSGGADRAAARIVFASLPGGPAAWTAGAAGERFFRLPLTGARLQLMAADLRREIADPHSSLDRIRALGADLYRALFGAIERRLPAGGRLLISLDRSFEDIPFDALVDERGHWFGARYRISYALPSMSAPKPRPDDGPAPTRVLAVGFGGAAILMGRDFPPLPDAEPEAAEAARAFPDAAVLTGQAANAANVRRELPLANVFHYSGHVAMFSENAAFALSGGALWASQISEKDLRACRLAVLAACSTAASTEEGGSGAVMARAFLRAGVPQVVAARWDVESRAAGAFMRAFYHGLRSAAAVEDALASAQADLRGNPDFAHPYYWAAFGLYCN